MFSQTSKYALQAAVYIAQRGRDTPVLAKDIAAEMDIPEKYLQKVLREMVRHGVLTSARGIGGGFSLKKRARSIRLAQVIDPFDDIISHSACPFGNPHCGESNPCPVHDKWSEVIAFYSRFLSSTTLQDLSMRQEDEIKKR